MCVVLALLDIKRLRFSFALWVACTRIPPKESNSDTSISLNIFSHGVSTFVIFVMYVSEMPYIRVLVVRFSLHLLHSLVFLIKCF